MELLRLGVIGLSEAEERLINTLFRLHRVEPSFIWTTSPEGPFDALLVDSEVDPIAYANARGPRTQVIQLGTIHAIPGDGMMPRPIRSDLLTTWLKKMEVVILHQGNDAFSSTLHHSQQVHEPVETQPAKPAPVTDAPMAAPATGLESLSFKLKRWPSEALHKRDGATIRLASMLTRRAMTIAQLSEASGQPAPSCRELIETLRLQNLLIEQPWAEAVAVPSIQTVQAVQVAQAPQAHKPHSPQQLKSRFGGALIKSIRQRFGIH